jgi:hypothetical protein
MGSHGGKVPIREDSWDNWHLSPWPDHPVLAAIRISNGATNDARWRIGWVTFDQACNCITGVRWSRC